MNMFNSMWGKKPAATPPSGASEPAAAPALFSGLSVKAPETTPSKTPAPNATSNGSAFGFITASAPAATSASQPPASSVSSAFSFLSAPASPRQQAPTQVASPSTATTGFTFLNQSAPVGNDPAPQAASKSAFNFLATPEPVQESPSPSMPKVIPEDTSKRQFATRLSAESTSTTSTPVIAQPSLGIAPLSTLTANQTIKKKRISTKRPGYARASGEYEDETVPSNVGTNSNQQQPQAVVVESSTSILAGLTIYVEPPDGNALDRNEDQSQGGSTEAMPDASKAGAVELSPRGSTPQTSPTRTVAVETTPSGASAQSGTSESTQDAKDVMPPPQPSSSPKQGQATDFVASAASFASALQQIDDDLKTLMARESATREKREALSSRIIDLAEDQNRATEQEDFEKAENLQIQIDVSRRELSELDETLNKIIKEQADLDAKRDDLFSNQLIEIEKQVDDAETDSRLLAAKASAAAQAVQTEKAIVKRKLEERENSLNTRLETARTDATMAEEEVAKLKDRVATGTVDLRAELDDWEAKVKAVDAEIEELEMLIAQKRLERATLAKHAAEAEEKVQAVANKYSSRLQEAEKLAASCQAQLEKLATEEADLVKLKAESETRLSEEDARVQGLEARASDAKGKFKVLEALLDKLRQDGTLRRKRATEAQKDAKQLQSLQDELVWKKSRIELLEKDLVALEAQATEDGRLLSESAKELPEMENQKQMWVSMRNFKEAGRVANDIKSLQGKRQDAQKRLEDSKTDLEEKRASYQTLQADVESTRAEVNRLMLHVENEKLRNLTTLEKHLKTTIDDLANVSPAPHESVLNPLLTMLQAELQSVSERARIVAAKLGDKADLTTPPPKAETPSNEAQSDEMVQTTTAESSAADEIVGEGEKASIEELEALLENAIAAEDFDLADSISQRIEQAKALSSNTVQQIPMSDSKAEGRKNSDETNEASTSVQAEIDTNTSDVAPSGATDAEAVHNDENDVADEKAVGDEKDAADEKAVGDEKDVAQSDLADSNASEHANESNEQSSHAKEGIQAEGIEIESPAYDAATAENGEGQ